MSSGEPPTGGWQVAGLRRSRAATVPPVESSELSSERSRENAEAGFDAWQALATWLREGRIERGLSIADVARTTKIQARILEELEAGRAEELPADVFVRGFIRNYARCVGLSEAEALARYAACGRDVGPVASAAATAVAELYAPTVRKARMSTVVPVAPGSPAAEVHAKGGHTVRRAATSPGIDLRNSRSTSMLAQGSLEIPAARISAQMPVVEPVWLEPAVAAAPVAAEAPAVAVAVEPALSPAVELVAPISSGETPPVGGAVVEVADATSRSSVAERRNKKSRSKRRREEREGRRQRAQTVRPPDELEIFEGVESRASAEPVVASGELSQAAREEARQELVAQPADVTSLASPVVTTEVTTEHELAGASELWVPKMPAAVPPPRRMSTVMPALVIDDADPESASRVQEVRASQIARDPTKRTFLPPILLESQDRTHRQGGLTLAVIILLIAATLTLSYLMRSPGSGGGGVTRVDGAPTLVG